MVPMERQMIDGRRKMAEDAVRQALAKGNKLGGIAGVERILQEQVQICGLPDDFFKCLSDRDLGDLALRITEAGTGTETSPLTPPSDVSGAEDQRGEQTTEGGQDDTAESAQPPTYEDSVRA